MFLNSVTDTKPDPEEGYYHAHSVRWEGVPEVGYKNPGYGAVPHDGEAVHITASFPMLVELDLIVTMADGGSAACAGYIKADSAKKILF